MDANFESFANAIPVALVTAVLTSSVSVGLDWSRSRRERRNKVEDLETAARLRSETASEAARLRSETAQEAARLEVERQAKSAQRLALMARQATAIEYLSSLEQFVALCSVAVHPARTLDQTAAVMLSTLSSKLISIVNAADIDDEAKVEMHGIFFVTQNLATKGLAAELSASLGRPPTTNFGSNRPAFAVTQILSDETTRARSACQNIALKIAEMA